MDTSTVKLTHKDYRVGWICALPKEQTAAVAMFDENHRSLPKPAHDQNTYTLGRVAKHNVVVACLPKGRYATIPAAQVAAWMMGTFPCIKIGLMVGIGGGIPPRVRLGHVVVSTPSAEYPGVVQWDMGKATAGGRFERTGALNSPPTVLLTALTKLESQHDMYGSKTPQYLDDLASRFPRLKSTYTWSDALKDPLDQPKMSATTDGWRKAIASALSRMLAIFLFLVGWRTLAGPNSASQATDGNKNDVVSISSDETRGKNDGPHVHYGLIASGNQVVKDADLRDQLNKSFGGNVLCIEMEAAGLMHNFPCIVIRGICDYADAQKNKDWQEYAAAVAAGYAKELLEVTDPVEVEHAPEARVITEMLCDIVMRTESIAIKQEQQMEQEARSKLLSWLSSLRPSARHSETKEQRVKGTGTWMLEHPKFLDWSSAAAANPVLCCYGNPGAGKTFISSLVIDHLEESATDKQKVAIAYMYCDYRDRQAQTTANVLGAVLQQLLARLPSVPESVWLMYRDGVQRSSTASLADIKSLVLVVFAMFDQIYLCLDALDELSNGRELMDLLHGRPSHLRLYLTFRPHIWEVVESCLKEVQNVMIEAQSDDLRRFIEHEVGGPYDHEPDAMNEELRAALSQKIVESAEGVFLLPVLQVRAVLGNLTISERRSSLQTLPSTLEDAFAGSFLRIQQQPPAFSNRAAHIIAWVSLFGGLLTVDQLLCSLAVREGDSDFDYLRVPVRKTLLNCCQGLVIVDQETLTVRLVHYSLQEYLQEQDEILNIPTTTWHDRIAAISLTFVMFPHLWLPHIDFNEQSMKTFEDCDIQGSLIEDAAIYWGYHLCLSGESDSTTVQLAVKYLSTLSQRHPTPVKLLFNRLQFDHYPFGKELSPVHVAAFFGLEKVTARLESMGFDIHAQDFQDRTSVSWASQRGHETVLRLLLAKGVAVNSADRSGTTPLMYAAQWGDAAVVQLLIERGAVVDLADELGTTALMHAAEKGHAAVVQLLIESGATVDLTNRYGHTALSMCGFTWSDHGAVAQILVEKHAAIDRKYNDGDTLLTHAAEQDQKAIARVLIDNGAAVDLRNDHGMTPLLLALRNGHDAVARLLIEGGAGLDLRNDDGQTPLMYTSYHGTEASVRLLIDKGAAVDSTDEHGRTPLTWAAERSNEAVARELVKMGASVHSVDKAGRTPLFYAVSENAEEMVEMLIENGAAVNLTDNRSETPLSRAAKYGGKAVVRKLIESGAVVDSVDMDGQTPLSWAAEHGNEVAAQILIENGAAVDSVDHKGRTPLSWATCSKQRAVVQVLIDHGAVVDSVDNDGRTPLSWAAAVKYDGNAAVQILIDNGAMVDAVDKDGRTPLSWAYAGCIDDAVPRILIENGAAVDSVDHKGRTPLSWAAAVLDGVGALTEVLLEKGAMVDAVDKNGRTPLSWAAEYSNEVAAETLIEDGAVVDSADDRGRTPLSWAAAAAAEYDYGKETIEMLLRGGAVVDSVDNDGRTPLSWTATRYDSDAVAQILKHHGSGIAHLLIENSAAVARILIENGAAVNSTDNHGKTTLSYAIAAHDGQAVTCVLLENGAAIDAIRKHEWAPLLQAVAEYGNEQVIRLLLNTGGVVSSVDQDGRTLLSLAAGYCNLAAVEVLLENGAVVDSVDKKGRTPLSYASGSDHEKVTVVQLLLENGAAVDSVDEGGRTPLSWAAAAACFNHKAMAQALIENGAAVDSVDNEGRTPLSWAAAAQAIHNGNKAMVRMLLEKGAAVDLVDKNGRTPLWWATSKGNLAVKHILEEKSAAKGGSSCKVLK